MFLLKFLFSKEEASGDAGEGEVLDPIEEAAKVVDKQFESKEEKPEEKEDQEEKKEEKEEEEKEEEELSKEQLAQAKNLFKLLNNPETSKRAAETLAKAAGLELKEIETKKEAKEAIETIEEMVKKELGGYDFLATSITKILEKVLPKVIEERTKDVREAQETLATEKLKEQVAAAQEKVLEGFQEVPTKVLMEVLRIQEEGELVPGAKSDKAKFFKACLLQAAENLNYNLVKKGAKASTTETKEKTKNPLNNLHNQGSVKEGAKVTQVTSFKDAIALAQEQVDAEFAKG